MLTRRRFCCLAGALTATAGLPVVGQSPKQQLRVIANNVYKCTGWPNQRPLAQQAVKLGQMPRRLADELALYEPDSTVLKYPRMTLWPKRSLGGRRAGIYVTGPFDISSDLSGFDYRETTFQGEPAFFHVKTRPGTFDDPPQFRYRLYFERSGAGYELTYVGLLHQEELPPMVQRYFDTFRVETPADE